MKVAALENALASLAKTHPAHVMLAMMRCLVDMVCGDEVFAVQRKLHFYRGVIAMLAEKGVR